MKIVELKLDKSKDNTGISAVSFVKKPAIEVGFMYFKEDAKEMYFAVNDEGIVTGPALIPNKKIYRNAESMGGEEAYVFFSEDTVIQCASDFLKNNRNNFTTLEHSEPTTSMTLRESWLITNPDNDKAVALGFKGLPKNTWMLSYQLDKNGPEWKAIKAGEYTGFSVEATFIQQMMNSQKPIIRMKYRCISTKNHKLKSAFKYRKIKSPKIKPDSITQPIIGKSLPIGSINPTKLSEEDSIKLVIKRMELGDYPWDECIADQKKAGHSEESANKICGYIKSKNS